MRLMSPVRLHCASLGVLLAALAAAPAGAVTAGADTSSTSSTNASTELEPVIVTATRREANLQNVPIAVTALTGQTLAAKQLDDVYALQHAAPNLTIGAISGDPTRAIISIRGPTNYDDVISFDPATGVYLDGVYIARATGANLEMFDMQRVEVLRGPQGTLFGRNTIGGAINLTTNHPTYDFEGYLEGGAGNFNAWHLTGVVNIPLAKDVAAVRLVGAHTAHDGYAISSVTGDQLGAEDTDFFRGELRLNLTPRWEVLITGDYTHSENTGEWVVLLQSTPLLDLFVNFASMQTLPNASSFVGYTNRPADERGFFTGTTYGVSGQITGELGWATVKSISAYRETSHRTAGDSDGTPYQALQTVLADTDIQQFSEELQIYGKSFRNKLDWIGGFYYFQEEGPDTTSYRALWPIFTQTTNNNLGYGRNTSIGGYLQATYALTDRLRFTAGVRYVDDTRFVSLHSKVVNDFTGATVCGITTATPPDCGYVPPEDHFNYVPFTFDLDYKPTDDVMAYVKFSEGFRSGGINIRGSTAAAINAFLPEQMDTWEGGVKSEFLDHHVRLNADFYYQDYKNIQVAYTAIVNGTVTQLIQNTGDTRTYGFEAEATALIGAFTLSGSVGTMDAKYTRSDNSAVTGVHLGDPVPYSPSVTYTISADYKWPLPFGYVTLHGDWDWRDKTYETTHINVPAGAYLGPPPNPPVPFATFVPSYGLLNGVLRLHLDRQSTDISLWARNLADEHYYRYVGDFTFAAYGAPGEPRTFGATVRYTF
jgi:iron complex outermembrane receptor protein